jgi:citrate synthase
VAILDAVPLPPLHAAIIREVGRESGLLPNVDFALSVMGAVLGLPDDAPFAIFAAARLAGWIAHALEQRRTGTLIRPRARYTGPPPELSAPTPRR